MKHDRAVSAIYGSEYDTGGFGIWLNEECQNLLQV
jgi:hypothetical protein